MSNVVLCQGDARRIPFADASVHCCITSPPYWGLRSYGIGADQGELGSEPHHDCAGAFTGASCGFCYVCHLVQVFREVRRVLRDDGTLWLNLGDSYAGAGYGNHKNTGGAQKVDGGKQHHTLSMPGLKSKNLLGMPWRVALALQADGWILRSEIVWTKTNPMPESVRDRPTKAHEQVFLFSKQAQYFYDAEAVRETGAGRHDLGKMNIPARLNHGGPWTSQQKDSDNRNLRTVWALATEAYTGAHFATMPTALVERCIKAGTSLYGACVACGASWERQTEVVGHTRQRWAPGIEQYHTQANGRHGTTSSFSTGDVATRETTGWAPSCACNAPVHPCLVFDPFVGSGTVPLVARALGRHGVGLDVSYAYLHEQARSRLQLDALAAWEGRGTQTPALPLMDLPLFQAEP